MNDDIEYVSNGSGQHRYTSHSQVIIHPIGHTVFIVAFSIQDCWDTHMFEAHSYETRKGKIYSYIHAISVHLF